MSFRSKFVIRKQLKLTDGDAAFLLGKGGETKMKIAKVSGADLEMCAGLPPQRTPKIQRYIAITGA